MLLSLSYGYPDQKMRKLQDGPEERFTDVSTPGWSQATTGGVSGEPTVALLRNNVSASSGAITNRRVPSNVYLRSIEKVYWIPLRAHA
jgi:hypothetical protein